MAGKWRTILRLSGFVCIAAGAFSGLGGPWPWVLILFGLGLVVFSGGFG